jgi:hypothetical protein
MATLPGAGGGADGSPVTASPPTSALQGNGHGHTAGRALAVEVSSAAPSGAGQSLWPLQHGDSDGDALGQSTGASMGPMPKGWGRRGGAGPAQQAQQLAALYRLRDSLSQLVLHGGAGGDFMADGRGSSGAGPVVSPGREDGGEDGVLLGEEGAGFGGMGVEAREGEGSDDGEAQALAQPGAASTQPPRAPPRPHEGSAGEALKPAGVPGEGRSRVPPQARRHSHRPNRPYQPESQPHEPYAPPSSSPLPPTKRSGGMDVSLGTALEIPPLIVLDDDDCEGATSRMASGIAAGRAAGALAVDDVMLSPRLALRRSGVRDQGMPATTALAAAVMPLPRTPLT